MPKTALEQAKAVLWGSYGHGVMEAFEKDSTRRPAELPPIVYKKLSDCDTDHLGKILTHLKEHENKTELMEIVVSLVLEDRNDNDRREAILSQQERSRNG